jgi:hypothetical protein
LVPGDLLEDGGSRARRAEYSNRNAIYGYGRWLTWLGRQGLLEVESSPADRIIPARVAAYIADIEEHNATQTLLDRLRRWPWSWIPVAIGHGSIGCIRRSGHGTGQPGQSGIGWFQYRSCLISASP